MTATAAKTFDAKAATITVGDGSGEKITALIGSIRLDTKTAKSGEKTTRAHLFGAMHPTDKVVQASLHVGGAWTDHFELSPEATEALLLTVGGSDGLARVTAAAKLRTARGEKTVILLPSDVTAAAATRKAAFVVTDALRAAMLADEAAADTAPEA